MTDPGKQPSISVVIPAYRRPEQLREAVLSVFEQDLPPSEYEVIVIDSSPDDSVAQVMSELQPKAPCRVTYRRKEAEGPGPSRNLGVESSTGPIVAFMDSDCAATPDWLRAGLAAFSDDVGIVQGPVRPRPEKTVGVFSHSLLVERETYCYQTANVFYRRECFDQVGGFMKNWLGGSQRVVGGEDADMAWRVKREGWSTFFCNDALVYHDVVTTPVWDWIWIRSMIIAPWLVAKYPEIKPYFYYQFFYDKTQAFFVLGVAGTALAWISRWFLFLWLPYFLHRASQPTRTLRGPLRVLRPLFYCLQDSASFILLLAGSIRARTTLL
jgi:cellulose synthase/poly-beta-1,6-N-acetylglucosamine synthase-like glycosyltransferase